MVVDCVLVIKAIGKTDQTRMDQTVPDQTGPAEIYQGDIYYIPRRVYPIAVYPGEIYLGYISRGRCTLSISHIKGKFLWKDIPQWLPLFTVQSVLGIVGLVFFSINIDCTD